MRKAINILELYLYNNHIEKFNTSNEIYKLIDYCVDGNIK